MKREIVVDETKFQTKFAKIWIKDGIAHTKISQDYVKGVEEIIEYLEEASKLSNKKAMPTILDVRGVEWMSENAINELLAEKSASITKACVLLIEKPTLAMALSIRVVLMLTHSPFPLRAFTDEKKAIEWLKQYK